MHSTAESEVKTCILCCESPLQEISPDELQLRFKIKYGVETEIRSLKFGKFYYCQNCKWIYENISISNYHMYINKIKIKENVIQLIIEDIDPFKESLNKEELFRNVVGIVRRHDGILKEAFKQLKHTMFSIEDVKYFSLQFDVGKRYLEVIKYKESNGRQIYSGESWGMAY